MIVSVKINRQKEFLDLSVEGGTSFSYPWIWLRDNCRCDKCMFAVTEARKVQLRDLNIDIKLQKAEVTDGGQTLVLLWEDMHESVMSFDWLMRNRFTRDGAQERKNAHKLPVKTWGPEMVDGLTRINYNQFMTDEHATHLWLSNLESYGITLLENCPTENTVLPTVAERVNGWLRPQHHGETFAARQIFNIRTDMTQTSDVYTTGRLNYHTDLSYCDTPPSMQMLHCLAQTPTKGGDSIFSDGFRVAEILKAEHPKYYDILSTLPAYYNDFGGYYYDFYYTGYGTTIKLDVDGDPEAIRFANHARYTPMNCSPEQVKDFYRSYIKFEELLENNHIEFKLRPGDLVCFDNQRVLHGRLGYEMEAGGFRHLCGSYIEWDDLRSARRVLDNKHGPIGQ